MTEKRLSDPYNVAATNEQEQITFAAIMQRLDDIHRELMEMKDQVGANAGAIKKDREESARARAIIYQALKIIHEDTYFYDVQFVGAFTRLSHKLSGLADLAMHLHEGTRRAAVGARSVNGSGDREAAVEAEGVVVEEPEIQVRERRELPLLSETIE